MSTMSLRAWQQTYKDPKTLIVQASKKDGSDGWTHFPIGMGYQYVTYFQGNQGWQIGSHEKTLLSAFVPIRDSRRRPAGMNRQRILFNLQRNGIQNQTLPGNLFFDSLPSYKFIISPEGNGIDCHRHYEALLAGCIPIIEENPLIREKYLGCPILFTKDYSEITFDFLEKTYDDMLDQTYDFSRLFLSYYSSEQQEEAKANGNYWVQRLCSKAWY